MIIPAILEKFPAGIALIILFSQNRIPVLMLSGGIIDIFLGSLFVIAFFKAKKPKDETETIEPDEFEKDDQP